MASDTLLSSLFCDSDSESRAVPSKTTSDVDCSVLSTGLADKDSDESEHVSDPFFFSAFVKKYKYF